MERQREVVWGSDVICPKPNLESLTAAQIKSIDHVVKELPMTGSEEVIWKVEYNAPVEIISGLFSKSSVFLFAETRIKNERGAQFLCREHYLFKIGVRGAIEQLNGIERKAITKYRPGRRW